MVGSCQARVCCCRQLLPLRCCRRYSKGDASVAAATPAMAPRLPHGVAHPLPAGQTAGARHQDYSVQHGSYTRGGGAWRQRAHRPHTHQPVPLALGESERAADPGSPGSKRCSPRHLPSFISARSCTLHGWRALWPSCLHLTPTCRRLCCAAGVWRSMPPTGQVRGGYGLLGLMRPRC